MELIIGGRFQGKFDLVQNEKNFAETEIFQGGKEEYTGLTGVLLLNNLDLWVKRLMEDGKTDEEIFAIVEDFVTAQSEDLIVICAEVGSGLVPMERADRRFRENVGSICQNLVKKSTKVTRVFCGIPTVLK